MLSRAAVVARAVVVAATLVATSGSLWLGMEKGGDAVPVYGQCSTTAQCTNLADACVLPVDATGTPTTTVGLCTLFCVDAAECPDGGRCATPANTDEAVCFPP